MQTLGERKATLSLLHSHMLCTAAMYNIHHRGIYINEYNIYIWYIFLIQKGSNKNLPCIFFFKLMSSLKIRHFFTTLLFSQKKIIIKWNEK